MKKSLLTVLLLTAAAPALAEPIYITAGQCIMVGSQQVCASLPGTTTTTTTTTTTKPDVLYVCRFGMYKDSETPDMKSFELIQLRVADNGTKVELPLKNFGMNGKEACEKELAEKTKG